VHKDIYTEGTDGQWIDIPNGTCNGQYYIVSVTDPDNVFLESNEDNNWVVVPIFLTGQTNCGGGVFNVVSGRVKDGFTEEVITGASITLRRSGFTYTVETSLDGSFVFANVTTVRIRIKKNK
jgi:hypothetical protein